MAFRNVRFPDSIAMGSAGGPQFNTTVLELASGHEKRNINWSSVRARYNIATGIKDRLDMEDVQNFFMTMLGKAYSFRFKDWMDYYVESMTFTGDGTTNEFQMYKRYSVVGPDETYIYDRVISKPVPGTVTGVTVGGVTINEYSGSGSFFAGLFQVDWETGVITFSSVPADDAAIIIGRVEFDTHVRFDIDHFNPSHDGWESMTWDDVPLVEVKERNA